MFCLEISGEGEPLLSPNLDGVVDCAYNIGFTTTLITNGHKLCDESVAFLFERNVTLVVSLFSLDRDTYERDNGLPNSFDNVLERIRRASDIYRDALRQESERRVFRMAIHTTAQADNIGELRLIRDFCDECGIFFSVAPLAPVGGGSRLGGLLLSNDAASAAAHLGHNSIILSRTSAEEVGREVCGTCLYGLNVGFDGNVLFDAHAGYEVGGLLGNVRDVPVKELVRRQRVFATLLFENIEGFCPVRDPQWPRFLEGFLAGESGCVPWSASGVCVNRPPRSASCVFGSK